MVIYNELTSRVSRTANSALSSLRKLLLFVMALVIMFVKEYKTFLCLKKKKKGPSKKVITLGTEMSLRVLIHDNIF